MGAFPIPDQPGLCVSQAGVPGYPRCHPLAPTAVGFTYPVMPVMGSLTMVLHTTLHGAARRLLKSHRLVTPDLDGLVRTAKA